MHPRSLGHYYGLAGCWHEKKACLSSQLLWAARNFAGNPPILPEALIQVSLKFSGERLHEEHDGVSAVQRSTDITKDRDFKAHTIENHHLETSRETP